MQKGLKSTLSPLRGKKLQNHHKKTDFSFSKTVFEYNGDGCDLNQNSAPTYISKLLPCYKAEDIKK